jgi:hypothetical protein
MAAAYLFSVQQLNHSPVVKQALTKNTPVVTQVPNIQFNHGPGAMVVQMPSEGFETESGQLSGEGSNPADRTLTENLAFTTDVQFQDVQSNALPGVSQNVGVQSQNNQLGAQGFNLPNAYDREDCLSDF